MKRYMLLALVLLCGISASGQDFIIEYDYLTKTSSYFKINRKGDTVKVKSPVVRQNQDVMVKVKNFNEIALMAETEVSTETLIESTNPFGMFSMLSPIFNVATENVLTDLFGKSGIDISGANFSFGFSADKAADDDQLADAHDGFVALGDAFNDLVDLESRIEFLEYSVNQLYQLSRNTTLPGEEIKEQARVIVSGALRNGDNPALTNFYRAREDLFSRRAEQTRIAERAGSSVLKYKQLKKQHNFGFASRSNAVIYQEMAAETEALLAAIDAFETSYSKQEIEEMLQMMQKVYFTIQNSTFTYQTTAQASGDRTNINLTILEIPEDATIGSGTSSKSGKKKNAARGFSTEARVVRTKSFNVNVSGGLKITPSIGITFPSYLNNSKEYYAKGDTVIAVAKGDNFTPNITAFVNFYPYTGRAVNFGGSFGIGIPLKGTISPSFMLGGSLILGTQYSITLTGGMAVGPVSRLERGQEVGQEISPFDDIETRTKYAVGFYTGISFALGSN